MHQALAPAPNAMQRPPVGQRSEMTDQALQDQLLANIRGRNVPPSSHRSEHHLSNAANPPSHNIDPAIAGSAMLNPGGESGGDDNGSDGRKTGKRELSTSKRAAQNRAAQRAFRQRKEGHIKDLETRVREFNTLNAEKEAVQQENYLLRNYIIVLQGQLLKTQGDIPPPPENIGDLHPQTTGSSAQQPPAPTASMANSAVSQLQASAVQAMVDVPRDRSPHESSNFVPYKRPRVEDNRLSSSPANSHSEKKTVIT